MPDPFRTLGLDAGATADEVRAARRTLAKTFHPDTGGDAEQMGLVNAAAGEALRHIAASATRPAGDDEREPPKAGQPRTEPAGAATPEPGRVWRDVPSFTVEALPVETFEALLVVTSWIGEVLDDDPPYRLDTHLYEPAHCWCRLDLVPDAGASTVSISLARSGDDPMPPIDLVRDTWVEQLNRYDWS